MNYKVHTLLLSILCATSLTSCMKEEAPNAEADITGVTIGDGSLLLRDPVINNTDITIYANISDSILAPEFALTDGATISPASGTPRQFFSYSDSLTYNSSTHTYDTIKVSKAITQEYTVTSQDGQWQKTYSVNIINNVTPADYHFDNVRFYEYQGKQFFHIFYETVAGNRIDWASGNSGAMVTLASNTGVTYADYPTAQADEGVSGKCAKLTTILTGQLGAMFGAPLAAGNLFLGSFVINMQQMASSSHFGIPLRSGTPVAFSGYYKYLPGKTFLKRNESQSGTIEVPDRTDDFSIYAMVYEVTDDEPYLDGNTVFTSQNIVLLAQLGDHQSGNEWVHFEIPFQSYNGKSIDPEKLKDGKYNISIVCSSSEGGASFEGAPGSTLYVDEFHISYE